MPPPPRPGEEQLPPITADDLIAAAATFEYDTGLGADNISPRALLRLSTDAIEALIDIYHACEHAGTWPPALGMVAIVLLPNTEGGFRPIGLFPSLIRVWMRAR